MTLQIWSNNIQLQIKEAKEKAAFILNNIKIKQIFGEHLIDHLERDQVSIRSFI